MADPYRDDRETLLARLADAERRAAQAEARARAFEAAAKRPRRGLWLTAAADELLVVETRDGLVFVEPGRAILGVGRRRVVGSLPSAHAAVVLRARAIPTRDGAADLDATVLVDVGADREGALRDLGLDVGEVQLARAGGEVRA